MLRTFRVVHEDGTIKEKTGLHHQDYVPGGTLSNTYIVVAQ